MKADKPIVVIGDLHGLDSWEQIVSQHSDCRFVFLGDYNDPHKFSVSDDEVMANFQRLIDFKLQRSDDVVLLLGNHDVHYYSEYASIGSRFNFHIGCQLSELYQRYSDCFQNALQIGNLLFTHAGVDDDWFRNSFKGGLDKKDIARQLNTPTEEQKWALHDCGACRGGKQPVGGIFWADITELNNPLHGFIQIVGHNRVEKSEIRTFNKDGVYSTVIFCDCLYNGYYLYIDSTAEKSHRFWAMSLSGRDVTNLTVE